MELKQVVTVRTLENQEPVPPLLQRDLPLLLHCMMMSLKCRDLTNLSRVARRFLGKKEISSIKAAKDAVDVEWAKLRRVGKVGCWDESAVREKKDVLNECRKKNKSVTGAVCFPFALKRVLNLKKGRQDANTKAESYFKEMK